MSETIARSPTFRPAADHAATQGRSLAIAALVIFAVAFAVRLLASAAAPMHPDEPYHILPARSWLEDGSFRLYQGEYVRAKAYTVITALGIQLFGDTIVGARMPAVIAGAALAPLVFLWTHRQAGAVAAWVAAAIVAFAGIAVEISAFARFYMLHALCIWLIAVIAYGVSADRPHRLPLWTLAPAVLIAAFAFHLQVVTVVGIVAIVAWLALDLAWRLGLWRRRWFWLAAAGLAALGLLLAMLPPVREVLTAALGAYQRAEFWNAEHQYDVGYYHRALREVMPVMWVLLPVGFFLAASRHPRAAVFCAFVAVLGVVLMSFGGMKHLRYVFFVFPFMAALWGMAAAAVAPAAIGWTSDAASRLLRSGRLPTDPRRERLIGGALIAGGAVFVVLAQPVFTATFVNLPRQALQLAGHPGRHLPYPQEQPWAAGGLPEMARSASLVLTSNELSSLMFWDRFDVQVNRDIMEQTPSRAEYSIDRRTGRPVISSAASLEPLLRCYPDGLAVVHGYHWRNEHGVSDEAADLLVRNAQMTRLFWPPRSVDKEKGWSNDELFVFRWRHAPEQSARCEALRARLGQGR